MRKLILWNLWAKEKGPLTNFKESYSSDYKQHTSIPGHLSVKTDIYGFGVVLLETITGLKVLDQYRVAKKRNLVDWARPFLGRRGKLKNIMDPRLELNYPLKGAFKCAALSLKCLEINPTDRPSSEEVLQTLEQIYAADM